MKHFIVISFIFLGWAFFELSDGMDFRPRIDPALSVAVSPPLRKPDPVDPVVILTSALIPPDSAAQVTPTDSEPKVTVAAIANVPELAETGSELPEIVDLTLAPSTTLVSLEQSGAEFGGLLEEFDPDAIRLPSVQTIEPTAPQVQVNSEPELPPADLRTISGTRVNMRNGPGTTYDVISRLTLGQEVEVLDDSGSGWLRLRLVSNRTVGWISASLVSKPLR